MNEVIVIGGGHAGTEAAAAAARCGVRTTLVTLRRDTIGAMSCNPAIGGLGKGHIVREVDAFDGLMGIAADQAAIHYRMLNRSKGAAVQGPRIQADRRRYAAAIRQALAALPMLSIVEGEIASLDLVGGRLGGVVMADGRRLAGAAVILATGTFLDARLFRGSERWAGGRHGDAAAQHLAAQLRDLALPMARLKTGTPPRLDGRTIDWAALEKQPSDDEPWTMSPMSAGRVLPPVACAITRTTARTHDIVRGALDRSPLFTGAIDARGPRYCPSIEDKIDRFGDRDGHQIFLEPEGLDDATVYPNGLSTSLPIDVQQALVASIPGLERAVITLPGYAVEYDHLDPRALDATLAMRALPGIYCAGQINGTTGYEEAAGQGLVAGLNAAAQVRGRPPVILDRASSYIGVMIDDLVLQGVTEPYRMLTARAEFRLSLRADNAETRLGPIARAVGCVGDARRAHQDHRDAQRATIEAALAHPVTAATLQARGCTVAQDGSRRTAMAWLGHPDIAVADLVDADDSWSDAVLAEIVEDARYRPYLDRQAAEIARLRQDEKILLPPSLDFAAIPGVSNEMVQRLTTARPASLAAAARIRGITPAALSAIHLHVHRRAA